MLARTLYNIGGKPLYLKSLPPNYLSISNNTYFIQLQLEQPLRER